MINHNVDPALTMEAQKDLHVQFIKILENVAPEEAAVFRSFGEQMIREVLSAAKKHAVRRQGATFEFGGALDLGLVTVHLVAGTLALIDMINRAKTIQVRRELESKLKEEWTRFLVAEGMSPELAVEIPTQFSLDLAVFLAKRKMVDSAS